MKSAFVFIAAVLMASCAKLEFDELTDYPVADVADPVSNVNVNIEGGLHQTKPYTPLRNQAHNNTIVVHATPYGTWPEPSRCLCP